MEDRRRGDEGGGCFGFVALVFLVLSAWRIETMFQEVKVHVTQQNVYLARQTELLEGMGRTMLINRDRCVENGATWCPKWMSDTVCGDENAEVVNIDWQRNREP